jgi:hypothetical protein
MNTTTEKPAILPEIPVKTTKTGMDPSDKARLVQEIRNLPFHKIEGSLGDGKGGHCVVGAIAANNGAVWPKCSISELSNVWTSKYPGARGTNRLVQTNNQMVGCTWDELADRFEDIL